MPSRVPRTWIDEYQRLVVAEASIPALEATIRLMEHVAGLEIVVPSVKAMVEQVELEESRDEEIRRHLSEELRDYMASRLNESELGRRRKRELLRMQERCFRADAALSVPHFLRSRATTLPAAVESLMLDVGLVVFHHAFFGLLPELTGPGWSKERAFLVDGFLRFSVELADRPDSHRIQGLVHDLQGDPILAGFHFNKAVHLTEPTAHEFMSLLQAAWSHAIEHGRFEVAILLLLENAQRVVKDDVKELLDLVVETLELRRAA